MSGGIKKRFDRSEVIGGHINAKSDKALNRKAQEYNRAKVTVRQNQKEEELKMGALQNMIMQQQNEAAKQQLMDMAAKIDLQSRIIDNKLLAQQQPPMPFAGLPALQQLPQSGDPNMQAPIDPQMAQAPMDPAMMQGDPSMDPNMQGQPVTIPAPSEATAPPFM